MYEGNPTSLALASTNDGRFRYPGDQLRGQILTGPMFILIRSERNGGPEVLAGVDREYTAAGFSLVWKHSERLHVARTRRAVSISITDRVTQAPQEILHWDLERGLVRLSRPWPGAITLHVGRGPFFISTHLRFAAQAELSLRPAPYSLDPGTRLSIDLSARRIVNSEQVTLFCDPPPPTIADAASALKSALSDVVASLPANSVLLLSGGIDSAALAAAASVAEQQFPALTWTLRPASAGRKLKNDVAAARLVTSHLELAHEVVRLDERQLARDVDVAILLSEMKRGTFIDDAVVYVQMARHLRRQGIGSALIGEAADDAFGCLPMYLRHFQGDDLSRKLRRDLTVGAPADYAAIRKIFSFFGIDVIDPYLSLEVARIGASLPLDMRVDRGRLMKPVLRKAFERDLPPEIVVRQKHISRDVSGVKEAMDRFFGNERERFLAPFDRLFRDRYAAQRQRSVFDALGDTVDSP